MKRALKKRVKAVLKNTIQWDNAPAEQLNEVYPKTTRLTPTRAAMIGLAISMGATSLLVTRQSDQAQAAAPVGSQKSAATMPTISETETKFATTTGNMAGNPVVLASPTVVSLTPGLEAKWQIASNDKVVVVPVTSTVPSAQLQLAQGSNYQSLPSQVQSVDAHLTTADANAQVVDNSSSILNAELKLQQESAIKRLQEKSNQLRHSLAQLRSNESHNLIVGSLPDIRAESALPSISSGSFPDHNTSQPDNLESGLKSGLEQDANNSAAIQQPSVSASSTAKVATQLTRKTYEVRPGDTLAAIASNYGISVSELAKANNLKNPNQLKISQTLIIPARFGDNNSPQGTVQPAVVQTSVVAIYPARNANASVYSSVVSRSLITPNKIASNSTFDPHPAFTNQQQSKALNIGGTETNPVSVNPVNPYGVGGDSPIPSNVSKVDVAEQPSENVASSKGSTRLRSLQLEIERLRQKYRAQQSGIAVATPVESENPQIAPNKQVNDLAVSNDKSSSPLQLNAIQIQVPLPVLPSRRPIFNANRGLNQEEPINPEFLPNTPTASSRNYLSNSTHKVSYAPMGVDATNSLGRLQGTTVSPQLPPLAAVDQYLPRSVEDNNFIPSNSGAIAYLWPAKGVLTSGYGMRWGKMHKGIDIANSTGTPIYASAPGVVEKAGWNGGYGNMVDIRHPDGSLTRYGHNSRIIVQVGQQIQQRQQIAVMGSTGFSTGPHCHFEIHPAGKGAVNPIAFLPSRL